MFNIFGFLFDLKGIKSKTTKDLLDDCIKLEKKLQNGESKNIDGQDLCGELKSIARRLPEQSTPLDMAKFIIEHDLSEGFPNVFIALRIFLTLPVTVASGERSFSKLKLIKTYLRSSMSQERLNGLAILSVEHELADSISTESLVQEFAGRKARKVKL